MGGAGVEMGDDGQGKRRDGEKRGRAMISHVATWQRAGGEYSEIMGKKHRSRRMLVPVEEPQNIIGDVGTGHHAFCSRDGI